VNIVFGPDALDGQRGTCGGIGSFDRDDVVRFDSSDARESVEHLIASLSQGQLNGGIAYMHSHEVTLERRVSLKRAIAIVVVNADERDLSRVEGEVRRHGWAMPVLSTRGETYLKLIHQIAVLNRT
jgi:hypothetical protein